MKKVVVIQGALPHYRVPFFEELKTNLDGHGIMLTLIHGRTPTNPDYVPGELSWATPVELTQVGPFRWHRSALRALAEADLVVAPQELKNLIPLLFQAFGRLAGTKFAYWGHGKTFQASADSISEKIKLILRNRADWWFAYNDLSAKVVIEGGFPVGRVTSVVNSIDTRNLKRLRSQLSEEDLANFRNRVGIHSENVAVFTGGMVPNKRIPFLIDALLEIRKAIPDFEMIFIGGGTERCLVTDASREYPWIHDVGLMKSAEIVPYWSISKALLMPGLVGLVILDTFALGVPMITTDFPFHSPEIDYLKNGKNGAMVNCGDCSSTYAREVIHLFRDPVRMEELRNGALQSEAHYNIENMASNFSNGVVLALR